MPFPAEKLAAILERVQLSFTEALHNHHSQSIPKLVQQYYGLTTSVSIRKDLVFDDTVTLTAFVDQGTTQNRIDELEKVIIIQGKPCCSRGSDPYVYCYGS